jgi:transcriptional regulator with XRE-family HTH domain
MIGRPTDDRKGLAAFLRAQREHLSPQAVGLPALRRRRTPGLRREEVALLAGISATWYTRIEQGRDVSVSLAALGRIAAALKLGRAARRHLFELAGRAEPAHAGGAADSLAPAVMASVHAIRAPAYVLDRNWTARAWNRSAAQLFRDWLRGPDRNLLRYVFLDPAARRFVADWPARARRLLAEFRADTAGRAEEPALAELIGALRAGSDRFALWWDEQQVLDREGGERVFNVGGGNARKLHQLTLVPASEPSLKLVVLLPASSSMSSIKRAPR